MVFNVPQGGSNICNITVYPEPPKDGVAQIWRMVDTSGEKPKNVNNLKISFSKESSRQERLYERMVLVFSIAESAQVSGYSWRFTEGGLMYSEGEADFLADMKFVRSDDGKVLTAAIRCLGNKKEEFGFSFLGLCSNTKSGECDIYASADPGGEVGRN